MKKQALVALMLALVMMLTGCTLVQKDPEVDAAQEVIRLGDAAVTKAEVLEMAQSQLNYMNMLYSMYGYGYDVTDAQNIADARNAAVEELKEQLVLKQKAAEMGLDKLTEEEEAKAQADAEERWQENLDYILSTNYADSELSDEEKTAAATAELERTGYTMETLLESTRETAVTDKLRAELIKDVEVTEEELKAEHESRVASAKETYENNAAGWTTAANNGTTLYYTPAGIRFVKQILIKFLEEDQAKIDEANAALEDAQDQLDAATEKAEAAQATLDREDATADEKAAATTDLETANQEKTAAEQAVADADAAAKAALETAYANLDEAADGVLAELDAGADWDTLMADRNQDPGMQSGVTAERGYAVSADMTSFDPAFVSAAMGLEKIGDVTGKIRGDAYGYYIIKYVADATEGAIDLEEVRETLTDTLLSTKQNETYENTVSQWVSEANFKLDLDALNN